MEGCCAAHMTRPVHGGDIPVLTPSLVHKCLLSHHLQATECFPEAYHVIRPHGHVTILTIHTCTHLLSLLPFMIWSKRMSELSHTALSMRRDALSTNATNLSEDMMRSTCSVLNSSCRGVVNYEDNNEGKGGNTIV